MLKTHETQMLCCGLSLAGALAIIGNVPIAAHAAPNPSIGRATYQNRPAFRLSDGRSEAVVVPSLGRVMRYGFINGPNFLWNARPQKYKPGEWKNLGGDKTWPAPQSFWAATSGRGWPPDPAWDGLPHQARVLPNKHLRMSSPISQGPLGSRVVRDFSFNSRGEFVIAQTVEKVRGEPLMLSIWSVTQIVPVDAIFMPLNPQSPYKNNFHFIAKPPRSDVATPVSATLLQVRPTASKEGVYFKVGVDAPTMSIAAVKGGVAFVQRAARPDGDYPDGAAGAGFPVELWNNGDPDVFYNELEFLSPLRRIAKGGRWRHTVRWNLHELPGPDANSLVVRTAVQQLLQAP